MDGKQIHARLKACGIEVPPETAEKLAVYHALLMEWNQRMDLTAVTEEDEMLDRHYVDSLAPLAVPGLLPQTGRVIDVGTGAGFPGMALAIACPQLHFTLLDAQQKRLTFLQAVIDEVGLTNVTLCHSRAEDGARKPELREQFDAAVARAVALCAGRRSGAVLEGTGGEGRTACGPQGGGDAGRHGGSARVGFFSGSGLGACAAAHLQA